MDVDVEVFLFSIRGKVRSERREGVRNENDNVCFARSCSCFVFRVRVSCFVFVFRVSCSWSGGLLRDCMNGMNGMVWSEWYE